MAIKAELSAQRYYSSLVGTTKEEALRSLYRELAEMEDGHIGFLERKLKPHSTNSYGPDLAARWSRRYGASRSDGNDLNSTWCCEDFSSPLLSATCSVKVPLIPR